MTDLYSAYLHIEQRIGHDVRAYVSLSEGQGSDARFESIALLCIQDEEPEDLRDWMRRALAAIVEAI
jgi:hypothetical protein